jgi:uncharacterized membrane protein YgdD (TMEM256/DUF423 family)
MLARSDSAEDAVMQKVVIGGALLGFLGVAAGAFGAHALKHHLTPADLATYHTAAEYQMLHALALLAIGLRLSAPLDEPLRRWLNRTSLLFLVGVLAFSGSLYLLVLTGVRAFGMVTPLGGVTLLAGWAALLLAGRHAGRAPAA